MKSRCFAFFANRRFEAKENNNNFNYLKKKIPLYKTAPIWEPKNMYMKMMYKEASIKTVKSVALISEVLVLGRCYVVI